MKVSLITTLLGYFVIVQFFFLDRSRSGGEARSKDAGEFDQRSSMYIGIAYVVAMLALLISWLLSALGLGILPGWVGWLGVCVAIFGLFLRWWANRLLGRFYTRTLRVVVQQVIVRAGPYRWIRHPGYLGSILMWSGAAAATTNWIILWIVFVVMVGVYVYRIQKEEMMLLSTQGDYAEYRKHTWRLIPPLF